MSAEMSASAITARLREVARLSDLTASRRLDTKIDLSPAGVTRRLREASDLLDLCLVLGAARAPADDG